MTQILTITGSDNAGWSGLQLDLRTITQMGGHALTTTTCIVTQDSHDILDIYHLPADVVQQQVYRVIADFHPQALKVGLLTSVEMVRAVRAEMIACRHIVVAPGILSSRGEPLVSPEVMQAILTHLVPEATVLMLRCDEAEQMLGISISTNEDMLQAAHTFCRMGAHYVLLRGGHATEGRLTALLAGGEDTGLRPSFFSSYNIEGWQQHGVGGALSAAIATRLGMGDDVPTAIQRAHEYVHSQVVYAVRDENPRQRASDLYNQLMSLIAGHYAQAHDVSFYADRMAITPRYLSSITEKTVGKSPKQVIADYLMNEARQLLLGSRFTIQEIALQLGFSNQASFTTFFRKQQDCTPSEFRSL